MAARFLLDTNICIYIRRRNPREIFERFQKLSPGDAAISIITYGELHYGAEKSQSREPSLRSLRNLVTALPVLPLPVEAGSVYGEIRAALARRGEPIGGNDLWIAAHAKAANLVLVTNNEREFRRVDGLVIENWADQA